GEPAGACLLPRAPAARRRRTAQCVISPGTSRNAAARTSPTQARRSLPVRILLQSACPDQGGLLSFSQPCLLPGASKVEKTTAGPLGQGTHFEGEYARAGTVSLELVTFERPHCVTFRARSRIVQFDDAVLLAPEGAGTRLRAP